MRPRWVDATAARQLAKGWDEPGSPSGRTLGAATHWVSWFMRATTSDIITTAAAAGWAAALVIGGLAGMIDGPGLSPIPESSVRLAGLAAASAGIFVFSLLVSDRLFRHADAKLVSIVEVASALLFVAAILTSVALFAAGAPS